MPVIGAYNNRESAFTSVESADAIGAITAMAIIIFEILLNFIFHDQNYHEKLILYRLIGQLKMIKFVTPRSSREATQLRDRPKASEQFDSADKTKKPFGSLLRAFFNKWRLADHDYVCVITPQE
jgi:hypothetical protein